MSEKGQPVQAIAYSQKSQAYDNAGYYSTSSLRKAGGYALGSEGESGDFTRRTHRKRCCVVVAIVLVVLLLIAALVLGLYFGLVDKKDEAGDVTKTTSAPSATTTRPVETTPRPDTKVSYEVILTLDDEYSSALDDPGTSEYGDLKSNLETLVNDILQDSDLSEWFTGSTVTGFRRGSKLAIVKLDFKSKIVRYGNQDILLHKDVVVTVVKQGLIARPQAVQTYNINTAETIAEALTGTGTVDLGYECSEDTDCADRHTQCSGSGTLVCNCIYGYYGSNTPGKLGGTCNKKIPFEGTWCTEGRHCATPNSICLNGRCVCDASTRYYKDGACVPKLGLNEQGCEMTSHCKNEGAHCADGICVCHPVTHFYQKNQCIKKKGINEEGCSLDWHCSVVGSDCIDNFCVCNPNTLYYDGVQCNPKKKYGEVCDNNDQCTTNFCKENICACQAEEYIDDKVCRAKKQNGETCSKDIECAVQYSYCDMTTGKCSCSAIMYQDGMFCHYKKGYEEPCLETNQCLPQFVCLGSKCLCPGELIFNGNGCVETTTVKTTTQATTTEKMSTTKTTPYPVTNVTTPKETTKSTKTTPYTVTNITTTKETPSWKTTTLTTTKETMSPSSTVTETTTFVPTTRAPDEIPTVDLDVNVVSEFPYDPELANPTSPLYLNYSETFKQAIEEGLVEEGKEATVTDIVFSEGSLNISFKLVAAVKIVATPVNRQEVQDLPMNIARVFKPAITVVLTTITQKVSAPQFLKQIDNTKPIQVKPVPDLPCKDGDRMMNYAETKVCGKILEHLRGKPNEDPCGTYISLLNCVAVMYLYDGEHCPWNNMRAHFKAKAVKALRLDEEIIKDCIPGNYYNFEPVTDILTDTPCMDVNFMIPVARFECRDSYNSMLMTGTDVCAEGTMLSTCVVDSMKVLFPMCSLSLDYTKSMLVEYQHSFFSSSWDLHLESCEYCLGPNIEYIMITKCGDPLKFMTLWPWEGADCTNLQMMIRCLEAYTLKWTIKSCKLDNIVSVIQVEFQRFSRHVMYVPALQGDGFSQCVAQPIISIGPPVTLDLCHNHNYITYLFVYKYTAWERINMGLVQDQCSEHLVTVQHIVEHYWEEEHIQCNFNDTFSAVWESSYSSYNILSVLKVTNFPGSNCDEHYHTNTGQCQVSFFSKYKDIDAKCIPGVNEELERTVMGIMGIDCGAFHETTRCSMRELHNDYMCQLQDIEPAVRASFFSEYPNINYCPSHGSGPFEEEVICSDLESLGAKMLMMCGSFLSTVGSPADQCSGVTGFGHCTLSDYSMIVSTCDRLTIARAFHSMEDVFKSTFKIVQQCFDEHPGLCMSEYPGNCTDVSNSGIPCFVDYECGHLEKCCSNGCYMECTTYMRDENPDAVMLCPAVHGGDIFCSDEPVDQCYVSGHCPGMSVCCWDGCQHYCTPGDLGSITTQDDCRKEQIIRAAVGMCNNDHTLESSCRSFIDIFQCVLEKLDAASVAGVQCNATDTRDDVADQVRGQIGIYSQCRIYYSDLRIDEGRCLDSDIVYINRQAHKDYVKEITPLLDLVLAGMEYEVTGISFETQGYPCSPPIIHVAIYEITTLTELSHLITSTLVELTKNGQLLKEVTMLAIMYKHPDFDKCKDPPTIYSNMKTCLNQFQDSSYMYPSYYTCSVVDDFARCLNSDDECDQQELKRGLFRDKQMVLTKLSGYSGVTNFTRAFERYDFQDCEERGDVYPCEDRRKIDDAVGRCTGNVDLSGYIVNDNAEDNYGLTKEICGHYYDIVSCGIKEFDSWGVECGDHKIKEAVYQFARENISNGHLLPYYYMEVADFCAEHMPVCNRAFIQQSSILHNCTVPYFTNGDNPKGTCSYEAMDAFVQLVTCVRLHALDRKENDCTATEIVTIINDDPNKMGLFKNDTDAFECIGDVRDSLDAALQSADMVCQSREALGYFASACSYRSKLHCHTDVPSNVDFMCNKYFWLSSCVETMSSNMTFKCSLDDIMGVDMTGTSLELQTNEEDTCYPKVTDEFRQCEYEIYKKKEWFKGCYSSLYKLTGAASTEEKCSVFGVSFNCFKEKITSMPAEFQCNPESLDQTVKKILIDFFEVEAFTVGGCYWDPLLGLSALLFGDCKVPPPPVDVCTDSLYLTTVILDACTRSIQEDVENEMKNDKYYYVQDENVRICGFYRKLVTCGLNTTNHLHHGCSYEQVDTALKTDPDRVKQRFTSPVFINPDVCQSICYMGTQRSRQCLRQDIIESFDLDFYETGHCRYMNKDYYWHCVKRELDGCDNSVITAHVEFAMMNVSRFPASCKDFTPSEDGDSMCYNATHLSSAAYNPCYDYIHAIHMGWLSNQTCNESAYTNLRKCVGDIMDLYSDYCYDRENGIDTGIIYMAHMKHKTDVIHRCFFDSTSGYCPIRKAVMGRSECDTEEYYNHCLSDPECEPQEKKCCYDGCGHSCIEPAQEPALWSFAVQFIGKNWKVEYGEMNSSATRRLMSEYQISTLFKDFSPLQRTELFPTTEGAVVLRAWFFSWYDPYFQLVWSGHMNGLWVYDSVFESQNYAIEKPDLCPADLTCRFNYNQCQNDEGCGDGYTCCENNCDYKQCEYIEIDYCSDIARITNEALFCAQYQLRDWNISLATWENCRAMDMLAGCIQQELSGFSYCSIDQLRRRIEENKHSIAVKLEEPDFGQWTQITYNVRNYNYNVCLDNSFKDIYPCDNWQLKERAWDECRWTINDMLIHLTPDEHNNYNVSPENCRQFYTVSSCVLGKLREADARCHIYDTYDFVYNKTRQEIPNGKALPEAWSTFDFCYEYLPVCTSLFLLEDTECKGNGLWHYMYMMETDCGSGGFIEEFTYYLTCMRLKALAREADRDSCTVSEIVRIIDADPFNLEVVSRNITDVRSCFGENRIAALDASLSSPDSVCYNPNILSHFAKECVTMGEDRCEVDWPELMNVVNLDVGCTIYFKYVGCILEKLFNLTFYCNVGDMMNAEIPQLKISSDLKDHCRDKIDNIESFHECDYSLINDESLDVCFGGLQNITYMSFTKDNSRMCSVYGESARCLADRTHCYPDGSATPPPKLLLQMLQAKEIMEGNVTCIDLYDVTDYYDYFGLCKDIAAENLCNNLTVLRDVTLLSCVGHVKDAMMRFYGSAPSSSELSLAPCRFLEELTMCGVNASSRLGFDCTYDRVLESLASTPDLVMQETMIPYSSGIDPTACAGPCFQITEEVRGCMPYGIVRSLASLYNSSVRCSGYNAMWHCVKTKLNYGMCEGNIITAHLDFTLREAVGPYGSWQCGEPGAFIPNLCTDYETLSYIGYYACESIIIEFFQGHTDQYGVCYKREETYTCFSSVIEIYSSGCTETQVESTVTRAIVLAASRYYYHIEHCFDHRDGHCPYVNVTARHCYGTENNTCMLDYDDCYEGQRCCFDGCASHCSDIATQPAEFLILLGLKNVTYYYSLYSDFYSSSSQDLIKNYTAKVDQFMHEMEQHEIVWISDWDGLAAFQIKAWSYRDPLILLSSNFTYTEVFTVVFVNYTSVPAEKAGVCLEVFGDYKRDNSLFSWCEHDVDCSYNHKCCPNKYNHKVCGPPGPDLPDCEDAGNLFQAASHCGVSVLTIAQDLAGYTCGMLMDKFACMLMELNKERPPFFECSGNKLRSQLLETFRTLGVTTAPFDVFMCIDYETVLIYYMEECDSGFVPVSAVEYVTSSVLPALYEGYEYEFLEASCGSYKYKSRVPTDKSGYDLQTNLENKANKILEGENVQINVMEMSLDVDHCTYIPALKQLGIDCVKDKSDWFDNWQTCRPVYSLAECISNKISAHTTKSCEYQKIVDALLNKEDARQEFLSALEDGLTDLWPGSTQQKWLDTVSQYTSGKCPNVDHCTYVPTLKEVGIECVQNRSHWFDDWQICRPVYRLAECITNQIFAFNNNKWCDYHRIVETLLDNENVKQDFLSELRDDLADSDPGSGSTQHNWVDAISYYSKGKCPDGDVDIYPCEDYNLKKGIYDRCRLQHMGPVDIDGSQPNYGITPENCRDFFHLTSCVWDEVSKLKAQCWNLEQFVYDRLREENDTKKELPSSYRDLNFCDAYQPVCSSLFIKDAGNRCQWNQRYSYRKPDCSMDIDTEITKKFVTCIRLFALSKYQGEECTPVKIKEIIKNDYFKLNVIEKWADIDMCLPDDKIANILPSRESVCTSGVPIILYQDHCTRYNNLTSYNNGTSGSGNYSGSGSGWYGSGSGSGNYSGSGSGWYGSGSGSGNYSGSGSGWYGSGSGSGNYSGSGSGWYGSGSGSGNYSGSGSGWYDSLDGSGNYSGSGSGWYGSGEGSGNYSGSGSGWYGSGDGSGSGGEDGSGVSSSSDSNHSMSQWPVSGPCETTARGMAETGSVDLGCMLYLSQMSCVQVILTNMSFTCTMDQLVNSPVPDTSPVYLPDYRHQCLEEYNSEEYQNCDAGLIMSPEALSCSAVLINTTYLNLQNDMEQLCKVYQESLACYADFAKQEGLSCTAGQLHNFQLNATSLAEYASRPYSECDSSPDRSVYDTCPAVIPQGDLCTNDERLANLVVGVCSGIDYTPMYNTSQEIDKNVLNCKHLQQIVWCGTNVTKLLRKNCTQDEVKSALTVRSDIVSAKLPDISVSVCQGSCYQSEDAVNECIRPYIYLWNMDSCRVFTYMWQCMKSRLGYTCSDSIINSTITVNLPPWRTYAKWCPDPRKYPLNICNNVTDLALLADSKCHNYLYNMSRSTCWGDEDESARNCYHETLSTFADNCYNPETLVEKAIVVAGYIYSYHSNPCIDKNFVRDGFCPASESISSWCGNERLDIEKCILDTDCGGTEKCCISGCNTTCRAPLSQPARWAGTMTFKNETFKSGMEDNTSTVYQEFMDRYSALLSLMYGLFDRFETGNPTPGSVKLPYYVWAPYNPYERLTNNVRNHFGYYEDFLVIGYPYRSEVMRPGKCPNYPGNTSDVCSLDTCKYDSDCVVPMAKCCYTQCYNSYNYDSRRCIDIETSTNYKYNIWFRPQYSPGHPVSWLNEFSDLTKYESESLIQGYDYLFDNMFKSFHVYSLRQGNGSTVIMLMTALSNLDLEALKQHIYYNNDGTLELLHIEYDQDEPWKNCSAFVSQAQYICSSEMWTFLYETDKEKKCMAYKTFVECMDSAYYCNDTEMRRYMKKNIHDIGTAWLTNSSQLYSNLVESLNHFDPYQCDGDIGPDRDCYKYINVTYCMNDLEALLRVDAPDDKCGRLNNLTACLHPYVSDYCNRSEVVSYLRRNIHSIGVAYYGNKTGDMAPPGVEALTRFDPYMCDVILSSRCPLELEGTVGSYNVKCGGQYAGCDQDFSCCRDEFGAHVCLPDLSVCSNVYAVLNAMKEKGASCLYGISTDGSVFCDLFWNGMSCLAEAFVGETFRDECLGRMKQVLAMYSQNNGMIGQGISDIINMAVKFPVDPNLCIEGGESVCENASLVYYIIRQKCLVLMDRIIDTTEEQQQCMAFEALVRCISHFAGDCEEERLRMLIQRQFRYMAYRFSIFSSPFYGELPTLPGSETPLNPSFLWGVDPDNCLKVLMIEPPKMIVSATSKTIYFRPGEYAMIPCVAIGYPVPRYKWKKNGVDFSNHETNELEFEFGGTLRFNSASSSDEGIYQCFADNGYGVSMSIIVQFVEAILEEFHDTNRIVNTAQEGESLTLGCVPPHSRPPADVHWVFKDKDGTTQPVELDHRIVQDLEGRLRFLRVETTDASNPGYYQCVAMNNFLREAVYGKEQEVIVTPAAYGFKPVNKIWTSPSDMFVFLGTTVRLMCIFGGNPLPEVQWTIDRDANHMFYNYGMELRIQSATWSDEGTYNCTGYNSDDMNQKYSETVTITIRIQAVPTMSMPMADAVVKPGETAMFYCSADGTPDPNYLWYINGVPYADVRDPRIYGNSRFLKSEDQHSITITDVTPEDRMNIQCNATNKHGYAFADAFLNVIDLAHSVCPDLDEIKKNHLINCDDKLMEMAKAYDDQEKCRLFGELIDCLIRDMGYDNLHCDAEVLKVRIGHPDVFKEWSQGMTWSYNESCAGDSTCSDTTSIMSMATGSCYSELSAAQSYTSNRPESCRAFIALFNCVMDSMMGISWVCPRETVMTTLIGQDHIFPGFDVNTCHLKCSGDFIASAKDKECANSFSRWGTSDKDLDKCRHLAGFFGCIKYHALLNRENCPVRDIESIAMKRLGVPGLCKTCDFEWTVYNASEIAVGEVNILIDNSDMKDRWADIELKAYEFDPELEWVGFGISYDKMMGSSDIITAQWDGYGSWIVTDRFARGQFKPEPDTQIFGSNDIHHVWGDMNGKTAKIHFSRLVNTSDSRDILIDFDRHLLYARGRLSAGDISQHSFRKASDYFIFKCDPYYHFDSKFPMYKEEICRSAVIHRHLWEYYCLNFDLSAISDTDNRCRSEISKRNCVLKILEEANVGCTMGDVIDMSRDPYVRRDLLDSNDPYCEFDLYMDTLCEQQMYRNATEQEVCYSNIYQFVYLTTVKSVGEVEMMRSSDGVRTLKCSLFEETLNCILNNMPSEDADGNPIFCTPADLAPVLNISLHSAYEVMSKMTPNVPLMEISYSSCIDSVPSYLPPASCPEYTAVADMIVGTCGTNVIMMASGPAADSCSATETFTNCASGMYLPNKELCPEDHVDDAIKAQSSYISQQMGGFDPTQCIVDLGEKCSVQFMEKAQTEECNMQYIKLSGGEDTCSHWKGFLFCIKYYAEIDGEDCPVSHLDEIGQQLDFSPGTHCFDYEEFEFNFPDKAEMCASSSLVRNVLTYNCITYDISMLTDPSDGCRVEISFRGCVHNILGRDAGCTMDDIKNVMRREDVRTGLLDSVSLDFCDNFVISECEFTVLSSTTPEVVQCYTPLFSLPILNALTEVDQLQSSTPKGGSLKCSLYREAQSCFVARADAAEICTPSSLAAAMKSSLSIYLQISKVSYQSIPGLNIDTSKITLDITECEVDLPDEFSEWSCSGTEMVTDMVVGQCSSIILIGSRLYAVVGPCRMYAGFESCLGSIPVHNDCPEEYVWTSVNKHTDTISSVMDGFNPGICRYQQACTSIMNSPIDSSGSSSDAAHTISSKCFGSLNTVVYSPSGDVTNDEICSVFNILRPDVEACLSDHLPDYCQGTVSILWDNQMSTYTYSLFYYEKCPKVDKPDVCSMFGVVGYSKCQNDYISSGDYSTSHCRLRSCFQREAPPECKFSDTQIQLYAEEAFSRFLYGTELSECTASQRCMVELQDSGHSEVCFNAIQSFLTMNETLTLYPDGFFTYSADAQCGVLKMASDCMKMFFMHNEECQNSTWEMMTNYLYASGIVWEMEYFVYSCQDEEEINFCPAADLFVTLKCHTLLPYSCNFKNCAKTNLEKFEECQDIPTYEITYERRTDKAFSCHGLYQSCTLNECSDVMNATCTDDYCGCDPYTHEEDGLCIV